MLEFHKHTNEDGEVLILRRIPANRITKNNFSWPSGVGAVVECPDWEPINKCGHGLHGWPWGFGLGEGCDYDIIGDIWLVIGCKPEDVVGELEGGVKCKFRRGIIRLEGNFGDAMNVVGKGFAKCVEAASDAQQTAKGAPLNAIQSGYSSNAAANGYSSKAAANGYSSKAAANGDYSNAAASGKNTLAAVVGNGGRVRVGERGAFAVPYYSDIDGWRFLAGKVGENGIKADTWYKAKNGQLSECANQTI